MKALDFLTAPETDDSGDDSAPPKIKALDFLNAKPATIEDDAKSSFTPPPLDSIEKDSDALAAPSQPKARDYNPLPVAGLGKQIWQGLTKPVPFSEMKEDVMRPLPGVRPLESYEIKPTDSIPATVGKEAYNLAISIPNFIATPAGAATTLTGGTGGMIAKGAAAVFSAQAWQQAGEALLNLIPNWNKLSTPEKTKAIVDVGGNTLFGALMTKGGTPKVDPFQEPTTSGSALKMPAGAIPPQVPTAGLIPFKGIPDELLQDKPPKVTVPGTAAEPRETVTQTIQKAGAKTIGQIQALFPKANLSREQARQFRNQAWGTPEAPPLSQPEVDATKNAPAQEGVKEPTPQQDATFEAAGAASRHAWESDTVKAHQNAIKFHEAAKSVGNDAEYHDNFIQRHAQAIEKIKAGQSGRPAPGGQEAAPSVVKPEGKPQLEKVKPSSVDTPTQGVLNQALKLKADTWKRVQSIRQKIKANPIQTGNLRIDLIKAESAHREALQMERDARAGIETRANEQGQTTKPTPPAPAEKPADATAKVEPNLEPPKPGEIGVGPGTGADPGSPTRTQGPDVGGVWKGGAGQDIYGVAARVRKARADAGQVAPVPTGQGISDVEAVKWGQELERNGADAEKSMQEFERTKAISFDSMALARGHGETLASAARIIESKGTDTPEYRAAQKALSAWDARSKAMQTEWHKIGMAQQGETDIDTGSFTGIARAVREVTGEDLTPTEVKTAKKIAAGVRQAERVVEPAKLNLETAIDNLTEDGKPRYSDYVLKVADNIVNKLKIRADTARVRLKDKWNAQFKMGINPGAPLPLSMVKDLAEIGAYHAAKTTADFLKWSDLMVREFGENVRPYLKQVHDASLKLIDAEGDKHGANADAVKKAVKKTGGTKAPTDLGEQQKVFQDYKSGKPMTPMQVKTLWQRAKTEYIDDGETNMGDTVHKLADDLGLDAKDVLRGLSQTKQVKRIADDVWQKQRQARLLKQAAKRWIEHSQETWLQKVLPATAKTMFSMKVAAHGTVAMGTHAPLVAATHPIVFANNFGKMYKLVASPEYYEMQKSAMSRRPNYTIAQRNGLVNDMNKMEDFNDPQLAQGFPKMAAWFKAQLDRVHLGKLQGMGTRGYSVLKILRQDLFDHEWDKLPESQKSDSMAKAIADSVNHITGVTKAGAGTLGKAASYALFAPKLEASRVAVMVADPVRAANSLSKLDNMTPAERWFVKNQFKEKAKIAAVGFGLLLANQQLNNLFGDKKKLNGVPAFLGGGGMNPMDSDFMKFRVGGMNFAWGSPFLTMARLPLRLYQIGAGSGGKTKYLIYPDESMYKTAGSYLRTQASPFLSPIISVITKGDYADRPLPQIPGYGTPPPVPKRLAAQGVKPYTWPEFISDTMLPIPVEQTMNEVWHNSELAKNNKEANTLTKSFITAIVMGGTGGRLSDDWNNQQANPAAGKLP